MPFINRTFTDEDLAVLTDGILRTCDPLDGVVDGMSQDFNACTSQFDPGELRCAHDSTESCLTSKQVEALRKQMAGIPGNELTWSWDPGLAQGAFRSWWLGSYDRETAGSTLTSRALTTSYATPVPAVDMNDPYGPFRSLLDFDIEEDADSIYATSDTHPQSVWDMYYATDPDLSSFAERGGKAILFHGVSDGAFPINVSAKYFDLVQKTSRGTAGEFFRFYPIPGMGHGGSGPATAEFDLLTELEQWVEEGDAPREIIATASDRTPWPGRTRPLCPSPSVAMYEGVGNIEDASSFTCR
jgi:hypothetical protein